MPLRYRIVRDRSHRDDDVMIVPVYTEGPPWRCAIDGEENGDDWGRCMFCNHERGTWRCNSCDHLNPDRADECEGCGNQKPEDVEGGA